MERASGILCHITSLPAPQGIGTLGRTAYRFIDFLHGAGQRYWQMLPIGPTTYGDSPYQSPSAFAGNPNFIDLDMLADEGLLDIEDYADFDWGDDPQRVDYQQIYRHRQAVLQLAWQRGARPGPPAGGCFFAGAGLLAAGLRAVRGAEAPL